MTETPTSVKIAVVQSACSGDRAANLANAVARIREAAAAGARIICLQELFTSLYFCHEENYDHFALAEPIPGPSTEALGPVARELEVVVVASLFERRAGGVYHNTAAVIDADGTLLGKYRKQHIPDDPGYYEKFYFTPGDQGYKVFDTRYARIGVLVCWDQWYPEAARITSLMGAQVLFFPTAIGWALTQDEKLNEQQYQAWQTIQRGHAIANGVFVAAANRTGQENEMKFWGGSFIADPFGVILAAAPHDREEILVTELDLRKINETRIHWPFLRDRRIDTYGPVTSRYIDENE
ncbi:MAG TPA: carbon-nitrogen hydrolase [Bacteroidales bacterium]|nr:carbon-nitrogen hydrolase [Bacteroidales bacterium]